MKLKTLSHGLLGLMMIAFSASSLAAENYVIDTKGAHASINFQIPHLGYSMLVGRFDDFSGSFVYDEKNPSASSIEVEIKTASINSNHAERDKHLRGSDFLDVSKYPTAKFVSTSYTETNGKGVLKGDLTLHGVTKPISIEVTQIGAGADPWGGFRRGFEGRTTLTLADFNINYNLGPASKAVELVLHVEGIRQ
ncbi:MAG: YceI family protein [Gammaproteobacteria bacterium]|nr:YceI family protein [Gammaproteobacteria bacterium]